MNTASSFLADQDNATGLATILYAIVSDNDFFTEQSPAHPSSPPRRDPVANNIQKIFIVHGHDEEARKDADLFLRKQGLNPVILMEQPSGGKTIIEKLEEYTDVVGFGIVLYTPCDKTAEGRSRARQNVVLEHGYLMGKLGRGRVCALVKGDVELPSDNSGIVYIAMGTGNDWKVELVRELKKTGYDASADKI
jgi:predicted nucleotide-binding protein